MSISSNRIKKGNGRLSCSTLERDQALIKGISAMLSLVVSNNQQKQSPNVRTNGGRISETAPLKITALTKT